MQDYVLPCSCLFEISIVVEWVQGSANCLDILSPFNSTIKKHSNKLLNENSIISKPSMLSLHVLLVHMCYMLCKYVISSD